jgi:hypothetical protein
LQALLDLAQYPSEATGCSTAPTTPCANGAGSGPPTMNATVGGTVPSAATTALFNVANSNAYYGPTLTAAPLTPRQALCGGVERTSKTTFMCMTTRPQLQSFPSLPMGRRIGPPPSARRTVAVALASDAAWLLTPLAICGW